MAKEFKIIGVNKFEGKESTIYSPNSKNALKGFLVQSKLKGIPKKVKNLKDSDFIVKEIWNPNETYYKI